MKRLLLAVLIFMLMLASVGIASANEPAIGSAEDNACNPGGAMAGKCETE